MLDWAKSSTRTDLSVLPRQGPQLEVRRAAVELARGSSVAQGSRKRRARSLCILSIVMFFQPVGCAHDGRTSAGAELNEEDLWPDRASEDTGLGDDGLIDTSASWVFPDASDTNGYDAASGICPYGESCPCSNASDCEVGICLANPFLKECAKMCYTDLCAHDEVCTLWGSTDTLQLCRKRWGALCLPCITHSDCQVYDLTAACLQYGNLGSFCGAPCYDSADCPPGYICLENPNPPAGSSVSRQCTHPSPESCACDRHVDGMKSLTKCLYNTPTEVGCPGERFCTGLGLSPCQEAIFTPKICK